MLTVKKTSAGPVVQAELIGVFDELANLDKHVGHGMKELHVKCREISRINSLGVKLWRDFFHRLRCDGTKLKFAEISPALVSQINFLADLIEIKEIESICCPYYCGVCNKTTIKVYSLGELKQVVNSLPQVRCESCKGLTELDELESEYFAFLDGRGS